MSADQELPVSCTTTAGVSIISILLAIFGAIALAWRFIASGAARLREKHDK